MSDENKVLLRVSNLKQYFPIGKKKRNRIGKKRAGSLAAVHEQYGCFFLPLFYFVSTNKSILLDLFHFCADNNRNDFFYYEGGYEQNL